MDTIGHKIMSSTGQSTGKKMSKTVYAGVPYKVVNDAGASLGKLVMYNTWPPGGPIRFGTTVGMSLDDRNVGPHRLTSGYADADARRDLLTEGASVAVWDVDRPEPMWWSNVRLYPM